MCRKIQWGSVEPELSQLNNPVYGRNELIKYSIKFSIEYCCKKVRNMISSYYSNKSKKAYPQVSTGSQAL